VELAEKQFPINIQTKSALVGRDLDLFTKFEEIDVGFTITTDDERVAKLFETRASTVKDRLNALEKIHSRGVTTFAFIGPILPGTPERLIGLLDGKVDYVYLDKMNYLNTIRAFYRYHNLEKATAPEFFDEYKIRLIAELKKRKMRFEVLF